MKPSLLALLLAAMSAVPAHAGENENDPYALGLIKRPPPTPYTPLEMAPVDLAEITADYAKDFSHLTKCPAYLSARKRSPYNPENPADLVVFTEVQKQEQSAAGEAMLKEIAAAIAGGKKEHVVAAGTYRINQPIRMEHARDFTLKFDHADIYLDSLGTFVEMRDAQRVNVFGPVSVTRDPKPFTMARVVSVNKEMSEVTLALMNGWDAKNIPVNRETWNWSLIFDPNGRLLPARIPTFKNMCVKDGRLVMTIDQDNWYYNDPDKGDRTGLCWQFYKPGNIVRIVTDETNPYAILQRDQCRNITYQDIDLHCIMGWLYGSADGDVTFRRIRAIGRPGTSQISGGMCQFGPNRGEIRFEECEIQGDADDQIDILSHGHMVYAQKGPREIWVKSIHTSDPFHPGSTMKFHDFDYSESHGTALIVSSEPINDNSLVDQCVAWVKAARLFSAGDGWVYKVILDRDVRVKPMDLVELSDNRPDKLVITGCYFHDGCTRVLIHGTKETVVENCAFEREQMSSLQIGEEKYWWEGPNDSKVTVRDCLFVNGSNGLVNGNPTVMVGVAEEGLEATCRDLTESVLIERNVIVAPAKQAIRVRNTAWAVVRNNRIIRPASWPKYLSRPSKFGEDFSAIYLYAVESGEVSANKIEEPGRNMTAPVIISETCNKAAIRNQ